MILSKKEEQILKSIIIASENDPDKPEFPADNPKFPATPTYKIKVLEFSNVWLKDESHNPTGTHKDRMAWEIVVTYRDFLLAKKRGQIKGTYSSVETAGEMVDATSQAPGIDSNPCITNGIKTVIVITILLALLSLMMRKDL